MRDLILSKKEGFDYRRSKRSISLTNITLTRQLFIGLWILIGDGKTAVIQAPELGGSVSCYDPEHPYKRRHAAESAVDRYVGNS